MSSTELTLVRPLEPVLQEVAHAIQHSHCPDVLRHATLVRLKEIIDQEKLIQFRAQTVQAGWVETMAA